MMEGDSLLYIAIVDLNGFFHQIRLRNPEDGKKLAVEHRGLTYTARSLIQGLAASPGLANRCLTSLFSDMNGLINIYVDDVALVTKTWSEFLELWEVFLQRLVDANLTLAPDKVQLGKDRFKLLGIQLDAQGRIYTNEEKAKAVLDTHRPRDARELLSFLSSVQWFRNFILNLCILMKPLFELLRDENPKKGDTANTKKKKNSEEKEDFQEASRIAAAKMRMNAPLDNRWMAEHELAFLRVKCALSNGSVLKAYSPFNHDFRICTDASIQGYAAVILQGYWRSDGTLILCPVKYMSRAWNQVESRYPIYRLEALAVLRSLQEERSWSLNHLICILTDNLTLSFSLTSTQADSNRKLTEAALAIQEYSFVLNWISTSHNGWADHYSRYPIAPPLLEDLEETQEEVKHHRGLHEVWVKEITAMASVYKNHNQPTLNKLEEGIDKSRMELGVKEGEVHERRQQVLIALAHINPTSIPEFSHTDQGILLDEKYVIQELGQFTSNLKISDEEEFRIAPEWNTRDLFCIQTRSRSSGYQGDLLGLDIKKGQEEDPEIQGILNKMKENKKASVQIGDKVYCVYAGLLFLKVTEGHWTNQLIEQLITSRFAEDNEQLKDWNVIEQCKKCRENKLRGEICIFCEDSLDGWKQTSYSSLINDEEVRLINQECRKIMHSKDNFSQDSMRIVVPRKQEWELLNRFHQGGQGHPGWRQLRDNISSKAFMNKIGVKALRYVRNCEVCAMTKSNYAKIVPPPGQIPRYTRPGIALALDWVSGFGDIGKHQYLLIATDLFSSYTYGSLYPRNSSFEVINFLNIIRKQGYHYKLILSDRASEFNSELLTKHLKATDCHKINSAAYHSQGNGISENKNRIVCEALRAACKELEGMNYKINLSHVLDDVIESINKRPREGLDGLSPMNIHLGNTDVTFCSDNPIHLRSMSLNEYILKKRIRTRRLYSRITQMRIGKQNHHRKEFHRAHYPGIIRYFRRIRIGRLYLLTNRSQSSQDQERGKQLVDRFVGPFLLIQSFGQSGRFMNLISGECLTRHFGDCKLYRNIPSRTRISLWRGVYGSKLRSLYRTMWDQQYDGLNDRGKEEDLWKSTRDRSKEIIGGENDTEEIRLIPGTNLENLIHNDEEERQVPSEPDLQENANEEELVYNTLPEETPREEEIPPGEDISLVPSETEKTRALRLKKGSYVKFLNEDGRFQEIMIDKPVSGWKGAYYNFRYPDGNRDGMYLIKNPHDPKYIPWKLSSEENFKRAQRDRLDGLREIREYWEPLVPSTETSKLQPDEPTWVQWKRNNFPTFQDQLNYCGDFRPKKEMEGLWDRISEELKENQRKKGSPSSANREEERIMDPFLNLSLPFKEKYRSNPDDRTWMQKHGNLKSGYLRNLPPIEKEDEQLHHSRRLQPQPIPGQHIVFYTPEYPKGRRAQVVNDLENMTSEMKMRPWDEPSSLISVTYPKIVFRTLKSVELRVISFHEGEIHPSIQNQIRCQRKLNPKLISTRYGKHSEVGGYFHYLKNQDFLKELERDQTLTEEEKTNIKEAMPDLVQKLAASGPETTLTPYEMDLLFEDGYLGEEREGEENLKNEEALELEEARSQDSALIQNPEERVEDSAYEDESPLVLPALLTDISERVKGKKGKKVSFNINGEVIPMTSDKIKQLGRISASLRVNGVYEIPEIRELNLRLDREMRAIRQDEEPKDILGHQNEEEEEEEEEIPMGILEEALLDLKFIKELDEEPEEDKSSEGTIVDKDQLTNEKLDPVNSSD